MRSWTKRAVALVVLAACVGSASAAVPFEKALPEDVVAYLSVKNINALKEQVAGTKTAQMLKDPAMKPFVDGVSSEVNKILDMAQQMTGISLPEILSIPTGQIAVAIKVEEKEPSSMPYVYFLAEIGRAHV